MDRRSPWLAAALFVSATLVPACAVKPPLRYVAPDGTLHDVAVEPKHLRPQRPAPEHDRAGPRRGAPAGRPPPDRAEADPHVHYATAVGLMADCRPREALAHFRGYLEVAPDGPMATRALVRMAEIHLDPTYAGRDEQRARELLAEVLAREPDSAAATVARDLLDEL